MEKSQSSELGRLESLPVELVQSILSAMPDLHTLRAAIVSAPVFYYVYRSAKDNIISEILDRQIDYSVLPEAIIAVKSHELWSEHGHWSDVVLDFRNKYFDQRLTPPKVWDLNEARRVEDLHYYVSYFAEKFAELALWKFWSDRPATRTEICRIERAFYRFEIYSSFARYLRQEGGHSLRREFFANFSPWENEQLACVHDFLAQAAIPMFIDIALESPLRPNVIETNCEIESRYVQNFLQFGLPIFYDLVAARSYRERYDILDDFMPVRHDPPAAQICCLLSNGLRVSANAEEDLIWVEELTDENEATHIQAPFFPDPDTGPKQAWKWAHLGQSLAASVFQYSRGAARDCGYVMWDQARWDELGALETPWEAGDDWEESRYQSIRLSNAWEIISLLHDQYDSGEWVWETACERMVNMHGTGFMPPGYRSQSPLPVCEGWD